MKILCVADGDTRLKWTHLVAATIDAGGAVESLLVVGRSVPTRRQLDDVGVTTDHRSVATSELRSGEALAGADVVVVCTVGETCLSVISGARRLPHRPVVVTGYAGLVYEKHIEGLLWRTGADVICTNSPHDQRLFESSLVSLGLDPAPLVVVGPGVLLGASRQRPSGPGVDAVVFATQPSVPPRRAERIHLLERLGALAERWPDRRVLVKLRTLPQERTAHPEPHHYQQLFQRVFGDDPPGNLSVVSGPMSRILDHACGCITISSTAAAEAMARSIPTAILTDVGVREGLGNHAFIGSGCLVSTDHLARDGFPTADAAWLADNGITDTGGADRLRARMAGLLEIRADGELSDPEVFTSMARTPHVVETHRPAELAEGRTRRLVGTAMDRYGRRAYERLAAWAARD